MCFDDHGPPHFHAYNENHGVLIEIDTMKTLSRHLPRRALALVLEWAAIHREELVENWRLSEAHEALRPIEPLE